MLDRYLIIGIEEIKDSPKNWRNIGQTILNIISEQKNKSDKTDKEWIKVDDLGNIWELYPDTIFLIPRSYVPGDNADVGTLIKRAMDAFGVSIDNILIIAGDIDVNTTTGLMAKKGNGGIRGDTLWSIGKALGSKDFSKLFIQIPEWFGEENTKDNIISDMTLELYRYYKSTIILAVIDIFVQEGIESVMNICNIRR